MNRKDTLWIKGKGSLSSSKYSTDNPSKSKTRTHHHNSLNGQQNFTFQCDYYFSFIYGVEALFHSYYILTSATLPRVDVAKVEIRHQRVQYSKLSPRGSLTLSAVSWTVRRMYDKPRRAGSHWRQWQHGGWWWFHAQFLSWKMDGDSIKIEYDFDDTDSPMDSVCRYGRSSH